MFFSPKIGLKIIKPTFVLIGYYWSLVVFQLWRPVLVVEEAGVPEENHRPWASNWKTLSLATASRVHSFCNLQSSPQCLLLLINTACLAEMQQIPIVVFGLIRLGYETTIYRTRGEHANHCATDAVPT
jgi:hypothetical protein